MNRRGMFSFWVDGSPNMPPSSGPFVVATLSKLVGQLVNMREDYGLFQEMSGKFTQLKSDFCIKTGATY